MPPHPTVDVERKEELILAKQLRACRVSILPRTSDNCYQLASPSPTLLPHSPQRSPEPPAACVVEGRDLEGEAHNFIAELTAMTLKQRRNKAKECSSDLRPSVSPVSPNTAVPQQSVMKESDPNLGRNNKELRESDLILISSPKIMVSPPPQNEERPGKKSISRFFTTDEEDSSRPVPLPPKLPFLNDIKMLKKADPVPLAAPSLELGQVHEEEQRWSVEDRHLGHIEKRPQLGKLPFLAQIKSLRPPSPSSPMPSPKPHHSESNEKAATNLSPPVTVSSPGLALVQAMKEICEISDSKPMQAPHQASAPVQVSKLPVVPTIPAVASHPPPPPPPPPQGWNSKCSLPKQTSAPAPTKSQLNATTMRRVESNSASQSFSVIPPSQPIQLEQQNRRSTVVEDSTTRSGSPKPAKAKKCQKNVIKLDERSNMGKLADQILPQLNHMQKNFLGLLFFNELSSNIVDDMVAQQLSMMSTSKLATVMENVDQEACDGVLPLLVEGVNPELRSSLACQLMAGLDTEEKAGVVFTTSENVMEVCTGVAEYGGRAFKKALIRNLMASEDSDFMDEIMFNHLKKTNRMVPELRTIPEHKRSTATTSSADDDFTSCEASLAEDVDKDEEDDYEYLDFQ